MGNNFISLFLCAHNTFQQHQIYIFSMLPYGFTLSCMASHDLAGSVHELPCCACFVVSVPCLRAYIFNPSGWGSACATNLILQLQECLQGEVVTLQQQLTWLQSHASLQDNINKDLMQEVLHLREAVACLSAVPPIES